MFHRSDSCGLIVSQALMFRCPKSFMIRSFDDLMRLFLASILRVSIWPETMIALTRFSSRSSISGQELVHGFNRSLIGVRGHLSVRGNVPRNRNLYGNNNPMRLYQGSSLHNPLIYPAHNTVGIGMKIL